MSRGFESLTCAKTLPGSIDSRSHCSNNIPARTASWENVAAAVGAKRSCWKYLLGQRLSERWPWIARRLRLSRDEFVATYLESDPEEGGYRMRSLPCPFLGDDGR